MKKMNFPDGRLQKQIRFEKRTKERKIEKQRNRLKHIDWFDLVGFAKNVYIQSVQFCKFEILIQFLADLIELDLPVAVPNPALLHLTARFQAFSSINMKQ